MDGQSNGALDPCNEVSCLTNLDGVNTYAIGIGGNVRKLSALITHSSEIVGQFDYKSFDDFERAVNTMVNRINAPDTPYQCVDHHRYGLTRLIIIYYTTCNIASV